jgi:hypothetical protein
MEYIVTTRDVDCSTKRIYKSKEKALARFEEMLGYGIDNAIYEHYYRSDETALPTFEAVRFVRGVSGFGCVVTIEKKEI